MKISYNVFFILKTCIFYKTCCIIFNQKNISAFSESSEEDSDEDSDEEPLVKKKEPQPPSVCSFTVLNSTEFFIKFYRIFLRD